MPRTLPLAAALLVAGFAPLHGVHANTDLTTHEVKAGVGSACLTGGTLAGLAAFVAGPAAVGATIGATVGATAGAGTATALSTSLATGLSAMLGCGASAATSLAWYGGQWSYDMFFAERRYPLLYPTRQDLAPGNLYGTKPDSNAQDGK